MDNSDSEFEKPQASSTQIKKKKPNEAALKSLLQDASKKTKSDFLTTMFQQASNSQLSSIMKKINARLKPVNAEPESPLRGILKLPKEDPQVAEPSSESKNKKSKTTKLERQNSTSKADQLSKVTPKKASPKKQPVQKMKKEVSDSSSEEEPSHIKTQKFTEAQMKQKRQLVQKMQTEDTDSSSDEEEDLQKKTEKIAKAQLQKMSSNKQPVKKLQKEDSTSDSSSDEEEGLAAQTQKIMHAQIKQVLQQQTQLVQKMQTEETDSSSDEEEAVQKVTKAQADKQPQKMGLNKKPLKKLIKEDSDSSSDEDDQKKIPTEAKKVQQKVVPKAANKSDSSSEDSEESSDSEVSSSSENEQPKKQAEAKLSSAISSNKVTKQKEESSDSEVSSSSENKQPKKQAEAKQSSAISSNKVTKQKVSDSSDSESSSSDEEEKPVKTPQANSKINNSKGKQSAQSPKKGMGQRESSSSGTDGDGVVKTPQKSANTSGNNRQIKKSKLSTNIPDEVESDFDMIGVANAEAQINLNNFAEMQRLKKAQSQLDISRMITDNDEVYYLRVTKNIHPQLLTDSKITLDAPDKFTLGDKNYKSTSNKDLKQLTLLGQCGGKYSLKNVPLAGCLTINEDHQLDMLNNSFEIDDDVPITVPSEKLKERHPLFGIDYVERIQLDKDIIAKLDGLINDLSKEYKKKKKVKKEAGEKLENQDIFDILKSHVPNKKERRKSVMFESSDVNMEIDQSIEKKSKKNKSANMSSESLGKVSKKTKKANKSIEEEEVFSLSPAKKNTSSVKIENNSDLKQNVATDLKLSEQITNPNNSEQSFNKSKKKKNKSLIDIPDDKNIADILQGDVIDENFHAEPLKKKKKKKNKELGSNMIINSTLMSPMVGQPNFGLEESLISMVGSPKKMVTMEKPTMNLELLQQTINEAPHSTKKKKKKRDHSLDIQELKKIRTS